MQQIADAAGVSRMAVSLALRNSPKVSAATAERIRRIADELGYRPNPMISALMTHLRHSRDPKRPTTLAYVTAFPTEHGWKQSPTQVAIHRGAAQRAGALGYILEEWWVRRPGLTERRFCGILEARNILGLVIAPTPSSAGALDLEWVKFAAATVGYSLRGAEIARASNDHFRSITHSLRELTNLGYRRVGLDVLEEEDPFVREQWIAAMLAFQQNLPVSERVPTLSGGSAPAARLFEDWFREHQPHAVISVASERLKVIQGLGLRVPQDVGFASLSLSPEDSGLAGINQNFHLVGEAAVDLVDGQLRRNERGIPRHARTLLVTSEWVPGGTLRDLRAPGRRARVPL